MKLKWPRLKQGDIVEVFWTDIVIDCTWMPTSKAEKYELEICKSVGYFLNRDNECLRLSESVNNSNERGVLVIPVHVVRSVYKLKKVK